jgi:uncharacterized protein YqgC (DUF456 family)
MADVFYVNQDLYSANHAFSAIWKTTRAMKKAGWQHRASSDGSTKTAAITTGSSSGTANGTTTFTDGAKDFTSLGVLSDDYLVVFSGAAAGKYRISAAGTTTITTDIAVPSAASVTYAIVRTADYSTDYWGTNADPSSDTYSSGLDSVSAWWVGEGPTILKIPIGAASVGDFIRGETITQATSSAEGELVGYLYDTIATSYLVVLPRSGEFDGSHTITGSTSGATVDGYSTPIEFVVEMLFWKATTTTSGTVYMGCFNNTTEGHLRFSSLFSSSGCTATVAPAGGGTNNTFPTVGTFCVRGAAGSASHGLWFNISTGLGKYSVVAANATPSTGVSGDYTFWNVIGTTSISAVASAGFGFHRLDNTEDGDVFPFAFHYPSGIAFSSISYNSTKTSWNTSIDSYTSINSFNSQYAAFYTFRRRGYSTGDAGIYLCPAFVYCAANSGDTSPMTLNLGSSDSIASHPSTIYSREDCWLHNAQTGTKIRKGTFRWFALVGSGTGFNTWDNMKWIQVSPVGSTSAPGIILGPWDQLTTPLSS